MLNHKKMTQWLLTGLVSVLVLSIALQYGLDLRPCPMCIFQRLMLIATIVTCGIALNTKSFKARSAIRWLLALPAAMLGLVTAANQSWLQAFPTDEGGCSFVDPGLLERTVSLFAGILPALFEPTGVCSSKELEVMGLSLANGSFLLFAVVVIVLLRVEWSDRRQQRGLRKELSEKMALDA